MPSHRCLFALAAICLLSGPVALAQSFPERPLRLVLPQGPGTGPDTLARALADELGKSFGVPAVVENRPGANGVVSASYVLSQPADGHTLWVAGVSNLSWNPYLYKQLSYDPTRDFTGVAMLANSPFVTAVSPGLGVSSLDALVTKAKAEPGRLDFASVGVGNSTHLATELLMMRTGMQLQHVPFSGGGGGSVYGSLISGDTPVMTSVASDLVPLSKAGRIVPLAVTGEQRLPGLPDVPTFKELGIDMDVPGWYGVVVRAGTPEPLIQTLNGAIHKAMQAPKVKEVMAMQMLQPFEAGPPAEVDRLAVRDAAAWGPIIRDLNIAN